MSDNDYTELSLLVYGKEYSSDVARRMMYGSLKTLECLKSEKEENISDDKILKELDLKKQELQKERIKLQTTKVEYNRHLRHESRFELFYENIKDAIESLPIPEYDFSPALLDVYNNEYVLTLSDIHYGAKFDAINNSYSREICKQRFELLYRVMVQKIIKKNISHLKVLNLSDTIQGLIHISDLQLNEIPVVESVVEVSRLIANFLNELSSYVTIEYYHVPSANHSQPRSLATKPNELGAEDMEKIIINYIHDLLKNNERIMVYIDYERDYITFDIFNTKCIGLHGHQIRSVDTVLKDLSLLHREWYDICFLGHRHTSKEITVGEGLINNTEVLMSPSFIGSCPYSDRLMVGGKAMCKLYEFNEKHGHIGTQNIVLN